MAKIIRQATVARDGLHNAFTDLQFWRDGYWVSYRKGSGHVSLDGTACISLSQDRVRFREIASIKIDGDNRDPKLFPVADDKLVMTIPSWQGGYEGHNLKQYITFSGDGFNWAKPVRILEEGHWLWRIREHQGVYYGLVQELVTTNGHLQHNLLLMTTENFLDWDLLCRIGDDSESLNESDIVFRENGDLWLVARSAVAPGYSYFGLSRPPYSSWSLTRLDSLIHAPILLEHEGKTYVSGRCRPGDEGMGGFPSGASLGVWELSEGKVDLALLVPAMGDCSYPGLIKDPEGRICLTYYSQHAYATGVVPPPSPGNSLNANDIFFAELQLP